MYKRCVVAVGCVLFAAAGARAADPLAQNAALHYWQAFALMPDTGRLPGDEAKRLDEWPTAPLDPTTEAVLKKYTDALVSLHRGAAIPGCAWASELDQPRDGIGIRVSHVGKSHQLRSAALLRTRHRFAHDQPSKAVDDLVALVRFGRHLEAGGPLVSTLAGYGIERDAIRTLGDNMWALAENPDALAATRTKWEKVPPPRPMVAVLEGERDAHIATFLRNSRVDPENLPDDERSSLGFIPTLGFILGWETREQAVETLCRTYYRHYTRLLRVTAGDLVKVPAAETAYFKNWREEAAGDDPIALEVARLMLPGVGRLRLTEAEMQTRRAMLRAAMAVAGGGPDRLKEHPDPFGNGPFETRPVEGGYELKSGLGKVIGRPVVLVVRTTRPEK